LLGVKTGMYYLRTEPVTNPLQFTIDANKAKTSKTPSEITLPVPGLKGGKQSPKEIKVQGKNVICTEEVCIVCQS
jgi:hypothetical protein